MHNGYPEFREFPKLLYNAAGHSRRVEKAEEETALGDEWQCRTDGSPLKPGEPEPKKKGRPVGWRKPEPVEGQ